MSLAAPRVQGKKVFITGGAGFIGSELATRLVEDNEVVAYDHLQRNSVESKPVATHPNFTLIVGDVLDATAVAEAMAGSDLVIHCAGVAGIDTVVKSPITTMRVNIVGSFNVLDAAARLPSCERVVCFSTSEIFGQLAYHSAETDHAVVANVGEARWTYAVSKLSEEHLAIAYHRELGLPTVVVRPFNVYGPGQVGDSALRTFVLNALRDLPLNIHGDGSQIRAWCYLDDMVDAVLLTLTHPNAVGEAFNIGNQREVMTIAQLADTIVSITGSSSEITRVPRAAADVELRIPSVAKAQELLGFHASVTLAEGIRRTAEHFRGLLT